jgi:hypothetical protein
MGGWKNKPKNTLCVSKFLLPKNFYKKIKKLKIEKIYIYGEIKKNSLTLVILKCVTSIIK